MSIENKELLISAINDYEPYNKSEKKLLIAFVNITIDGMITTSVTSLSKLIGFTRAMVYKSLLALEQDNAIKRTNVKQARVSTFEVNYARLRYITEIYLKKQDFINK